MYDWGLRFQQEGATATVDVADDAPVFRADKALLKRVLSNLVQNAVTHTAGPVHLAFAARADANGILFTVADDGPGIPAEYQEIIFRKFERVRAAERAARAQLGARPHVLPPGGGGARRAHLGEERGGRGEHVLRAASAGAVRAASRTLNRTGEAAPPPAASAAPVRT